MLDRLRKTLNVSLQFIVIGLMIILTALVVTAVVYRKMDASLSWYDEVASILLAWITYYGAALAALHRQHLGFDSVLLAMPKPLRLSMVVVAEVAVIGFFIVLGWAGWVVLEAIGDETLVSLTWVPVWFTQSVIPIGAALFVVCELVSLPAYWKMVSDGVSTEHAAHADVQAN